MSEQRQGQAGDHRPAGGHGMTSGRRRGGPMGGPHGAMMPGEKAKNFMPSLKRLLAYFAPQRVKFIAVFILAVGSTVFSIVGPRVLGMATTKLGEGVVSLKAGTAAAAAFDMAGIARILMLMAGLYVLSAGLSFLMAFLMSDVSQKTAYQMRREIKQKLDRLPLKYFDQHSHGDILSRVTNDMDNISHTLQQSLTQMITSVVTVAGTVVMMLLISPMLALVAFVILPTSAFLMSLIIRNSQKFFSAQQKILGRLNGHIEEMFTGHKAVKAFGHEKQSLEEFDAMNNELCGVGAMAQFISGIVPPVIGFVNKLGYAAVCVLGGIYVIRGGLKIGDVQAFLQYLNNFGQPLGQIASIANIIQSTVASAERVFEVMDGPEEIADSSQLSVEDGVTFADALQTAATQTGIKQTGAAPVRGQVDFTHVKFSYTPETPLMSDMNLHAGAGQTIAIVGPTGAGKTTLVNLLMRFYEVNSGVIALDGVDITKLPRGELRRNFGMVLQDTWLFNGTIYDNIQYGRDDATRDEVVTAAKTALADRFIRTLPEGYDTVLNEDASNISQGQRQLLTIARAILADPRVLILDEATSNVDTRTEVLIQEAMYRLMHNRTSFVIAHRLSTIRNADTILVMSHGDIIEQGSHPELMAKNGFYAELYNSQFAEE